MLTIDLFRILANISFIIFFARKTTTLQHSDMILDHRRSQHEARGGNCLLLNFRINNDLASCFASSNKRMIEIPTNYHKLVFVLQPLREKSVFLIKNMNEIVPKLRSH